MSDSEQDQELRVYVELLHILPSSCPPDYFVLLDLKRNCTDLATVEEAAKLRASLFTKNLPSELHLVARKILRRIERARICLSDPKARAAYLSTLEDGLLFGNAKDSTSSSTLRIDPRALASARATQAAPAVRPKVSAHAQPRVNHPSRAAAQSQPSGGKHPVKRPADNVLDLGPSTHVVLNPPRKDSLMPLYSVFAVLGLAIVVGLAFALFGGSHSPTSSAELAAASDGGPASSLEMRRDLNDPKSSSDDRAVSETTSVEPQPAQPLPELQPKAKTDKGTITELFEETEEPHSQKSAVAVEATEGENPPSETSDQPNLEVVSLASLEQAVALPLFEAKESEASNDDNAEVDQAKLGAINPLTLQQVQIRLAQPTIPKFPGTEFALQETVDANNLKSWEIRLIAVQEEESAATKPDSNLNPLTGLDLVVGKIALEEDYLTFRWEKVEQRQIAEQFRNCILLLSAGVESCRIQLRPTQAVGPFVTDLTDRHRLFDLDELALPASEGMQLRVYDVSLSGVEFEMEPTDGIGHFGDAIDVKLLGWQGDASLRFLLTGKKESPSIRFTPRYKIGTKRNMPLTSSELRSAIQNMQDALADGRGRLSFSQGQVSSLPGQISSTLSSDNGRNTAAVRAEAGRLQRQLRSAEGTIRRMTQSIPKMEATIQGLEQLAALARRFDQSGTIQFEVVVPCHDEELVLITTSL